MTTSPLPHEGLGVAQYAWMTSPLRRYCDMVNQWQLIACLKGETPAFAQKSAELFGAMRDFEQTYAAYADFQRQMERYWCLRWLLQENVQQIEAVVLRENTVRLATIPLLQRIPSLPELPPNSRVILEIGEVDLLDLNVQARFVSVVAENEESTACHP